MRRAPVAEEPHLRLLVTRREFQRRGPGLGGTKLRGVQVAAQPAQIAIPDRRQAAAPAGIAADREQAVQHLPAGADALVVEDRAGRSDVVVEDRQTHRAGELYEPAAQRSVDV